MNPTERKKARLLQKILLPARASIRIESFQERMLLERDQLSDRINKLSAFIERYNNPQDALPENAPSGYELGLMSDQLEHMLQYLFVLNQRIGASIKHSPCKVAAAAGLIRDPEPDPIPEPEQFDQPETPES